MYKLLLLFISSLMSSFCQSQEYFSWPSSFEVTDNSKLGIPNGFIQIYSVRDSKSKETIHKFTFYNENMDTDTILEVRLNKTLQALCYSNNYAHFIYNFGKTTEIVTINTITKKITRINAETTWGIPDKVYVLGDFLFYKISNEPEIRVLNWKTGVYQNKKIVIEKLKFIKLISIEKIINEEAIFLNIYGLENNSYSNFLVKYDASAEQNQIIKINSNKLFLSHFSCYYDVEENTYLVNGAYSNNNKQKSVGLFLGKIDSLSNIIFLKFYNFLDVKNFYEFTEYKLKDRKENLRYDITCSSLLKYNHNYFFLGEGYYPSYSSSSGGIGLTGSYSSGTMTSINGFYKTHVFIINFTLEGEMLWSQVFEMKPSYRFDKLIINTQAKIGSDGIIVLTYPNGSFLETKKIDANGLLIE